MLGNYLITALRNIFRSKAHSLINVIGLSLGLTCCIVVGVFVSTEFQFDTHHEHPDRIYRVLRKKPRSEGNLFYSRTCAAQLAPTLRQEYAEVETSVRTFNRFSWIEVDGKGFNALVCLTEPSIFDVFSYEFVQGKPSDLETPYTAFITESLASRVFGAADPIGQTIYVDYKWGVVGDFTVVGILEDMPRTSSFATRFDFITTTIPPGHLRDSLWSRWPPVTQNTHPFNTFVVLRPDADPAVLEAKLPAIIERHYGGEALKTNSYHLQPLLRMNLYSREDYGFDSGSNDISTVRVFFAIGMLILLVACANYINLATAQASQRAREVGVRKCVGARRHQMVWQFIGESVLLVAIAMVLALSIVGLTLPALGSALGQRFTMDAIDSTWLIGGSILLPIVVGTIAGTYPALYLTRVQAVDALKSKQGGTGGVSWLRQTLVVFQFATSIVLVVGSMTAYRQIEHMRTQTLGYDREGLVVLPIFNRNRELIDRFETVKQAFLQHPNVLKAAASHLVLGQENSADQAEIESVDTGKAFKIPLHFIEPDFIDTYGIKFLFGRVFTLDLMDRAVILSRKAAQNIGWMTPSERWSASEENPGRSLGCSRTFRTGRFTSRSGLWR